MDKLTAQKVLGVSPGASKKEIKKAYAAMLRMYHPEDYPQEFQRIQEAYEILIKGKGEGGGFWKEKEPDMEAGVPQERQEESQNRESEFEAEESGQQEKEEEPDPEEPGQQEPEPLNWEELEQEESFRQAGDNWETWKRQWEEELRREEEERRKFQEEETRRARQQEERYRRARQEEELRKAREKIDFEKIEWKAREEKKLKDQANIALALKDLEIILTTNSKKHRLKCYEDFFAKEEYKDLLFDPECVEGVCRLLENTHLKREVYEIFAREYHMREYQPEQLKPGARKLYHILDSHCKFKKKRRKYYIGGWIFVAVLVLLRSMMRATDDNDWFYFLLALVIAGLYWGYSRLLKYYSRWRIHVVYSLLITVSQFIMLMAEAYTPLLGNQEAGDTFGALVFTGGCLYFLITVAAYIITRILHRFKRHG